DADLVRFLQRAAGYALTGSTREHALFFGYGTGGNGKGVFLNTLAGIFGDYATIAPMETFAATQTDRHPTELAMLRGARLVTAQETEQGRAWAESRIKSLTGGDPITARFMRADFFTYQPQFKLFIAGNHKPALRNVDEAMRRRMHMIPFTVTIPPDQRNPNLAAELKAEWPAILAWAIAGCLDWQRQGLAAPAAVAAATDEYLSGEDALGQWIEECCEVGRHCQEGSTVLYSAWKTWAERAGEQAGTQRRFSQALQTRGFTPSRLPNSKAAFDGIRLPIERPHHETDKDRD
ncbi:phage/plasmid primase, P4 family, partial [Acidisphaera rubrifaciens]|uniref:phage/plasmid primase, P4 family n=1 Tax=Acidisphaera rubrifaciens TaxID=50715 RepID=UPI000662C1F3